MLKVYKIEMNQYLEQAKYRYSYLCFSLMMFIYQVEKDIYSEEKSKRERGRENNAEIVYRLAY